MAAGTQVSCRAAIRLRFLLGAARIRMLSRELHGFGEPEDWVDQIFAGTYEPTPSNYILMSAHADVPATQPLPD